VVRIVNLEIFGGGSFVCRKKNAFHFLNADLFLLYDLIAFSAFSMLKAEAEITNSFTIYQLRYAILIILNILDS